MKREVVATMSARDIPPGCSLQAGGQLIVHRDPSGSITAALNKCRHQGGRMRVVDDCTLVCPRHDWLLDAASMRYLSPDGMAHPTLEVVVDGDRVDVWRDVPRAPWSSDARRPAELADGELVVRFLAHASVEVRCGAITLVTDPWLVGPAFTRGWWLAHEPPADWLSTLAGSDAIYISHNHPDHLSPHTLRTLADVNPDVAVFVPDFGTGSCERLVRASGMRNVVVAPFGQWLHLDDDTRMMLLPDAAGRQDSGLLVDYRGHLVLNTVDCANLNDGDLPQRVDVLLSSFAGGATGYPICWEELYSPEEIAAMVARSRAALLKRLAETARVVQPSIFIPFAGYFVEAHPSDRDIRERNIKNSPEKAIASVARASPRTTGWVPSPGGCIDAATGRPLDEGSGSVRTSWDAELAAYVPPIDEAAGFEPLTTLEGLQTYFAWTGFSGDLVLHVVETDETFARVVRESYVDFRDLRVTATRPAGEHRYLRMRVRVGPFRHVLRWGLPWEELSIGFQCRFYREPDRYNFDFWDHMQNHLPAVLPWDGSASAVPEVDRMP